MAAPAAAVVDDFNRASLGANWATYAAAGSPLTISSNRLTGGGGYVGSYYSAQDEARPCELAVTLVSGLRATTNYTGVGLIDTPGTTSGNDDGYFVATDTSPADEEIVLFRTDNNVDTELDVWAPGGFLPDNLRVALQLDATHARLWTNTAGGGWVEQGQAADTTYTVALFPVVDIFGGSVLLDDLAFAAIGGGGTDVTITASPGIILLGAGSHTATFTGTVTASPGVLNLGAGTHAAAVGDTVTASPGVLTLGAGTHTASFTGTVTASPGIILLGAPEHSVTAGNAITASPGVLNLGAGSHVLAGDVVEETNNGSYLLPLRGVG